MSDLISRQAAIDALDVLCQEHRYRIPGKRETYSQYNEAWQDALDRAEGAIGNLPSAQPEPRWIPCSERLPEEPYGCLVTVWDTNPVTMDEFENILPYFVGWDGEQWNDGDGEQCPFEVVAWMPLPEPFHAERSKQ